jgi:hypothetical protein
MQPQPALRLRGEPSPTLSPVRPAAAGQTLDKPSNRQGMTQNRAPQKPQAPAPSRFPAPAQDFRPAASEHAAAIPGGQPGRRREFRATKRTGPLTHTNERIQPGVLDMRDAGLPSWNGRIFRSKPLSYHTVSNNGSYQIPYRYRIPIKYRIAFRFLLRSWN